MINNVHILYESLLSLNYNTDVIEQFLYLTYLSLSWLIILSWSKLTSTRLYIRYIMKYMHFYKITIKSVSHEAVH